MSPEKRLLSAIATMIVFFAILSLCSSCTVSEQFTEHNTNDYYVLDYEYPYAHVLVMPDSTEKYVYTTDTTIKSRGYLICER